MKEIENKIGKAKKLVGTRGRIFKGNVIKKFEKRAVIEFERTVYISKYERFLKRKTRIHARIPEGMEVEIGDLVKVQECRPLSKITHFVIVDKLEGEK